MRDELYELQLLYMYIHIPLLVVSHIDNVFRQVYIFVHRINALRLFKNTTDMVAIYTGDHSKHVTLISSER